MHLLVLRSGLDPSAIRAAAPSALLCDTAWRCSPAEALALLQRPGYATVVADARAVESSPEGWALRRLLDDRVRSRTARLTWVVVEDCKAPGPALEPGVR